MKNTSVVAIGAGAALFAAAVGVGVATAQPATSRFPITSDQKSTADQVAQAGVPLSALAPNAPESYTIKRGDTLWDLSKMYLVSPWRWPELWGMNKDQIRNPHLIYPGQELRLVKEGGRARLEIAGGSSGPLGDSKLQPQIRDRGGDRQAIRSIPASLIEPFLSQPLVLDANGLAEAARIVATQEGRVYVGRGDEAYVRGLSNDSVINYSAYRPLRPLFDPDDTVRKTPIAYEAFYLGTVSVVRPGEVAKVKVESSKQEMGVGDRLLPVERQPVIFYVPKRPERPIEARVISIYDGVRYAGGGQIATLNRGSNEGLVIGDVLQVWRAGKTIEDRTLPGKQFVKLPDERLGLAFVFRVSPNISYALLQGGTEPVEVGDRAANPSDAVDLDLNRLDAFETEADRVLRQPLRPLTPQ
jgi:LysM repeat protein